VSERATARVRLEGTMELVKMSEVGEARVPLKSMMEVMEVAEVMEMVGILEPEADVRTWPGHPRPAGFRIGIVGPVGRITGDGLPRAAHETYGARDSRHQECHSEHKPASDVAGRRDPHGLLYRLTLT
jgi:hypothetical protein